MAYATIADAETLYGAAYIATVCDRDLDGSVDTTSFEMQLQVATDQMDGYLLGRYPLPLETPPAIFKKTCIDIACYNAAPTQDVRTEEMRKRFDDAIRYMEQIACNKIKLKIAEDTTTVNESHRAETVPSRQMTFATGARTFTLKNLGRIL